MICERNVNLRILKKVLRGLQTALEKNYKINTKKYRRSSCLCAQKEPFLVQKWEAQFLWRLLISEWKVVLICPSWPKGAWELTFKIVFIFAPSNFFKSFKLKLHVRQCFSICDQMMHWINKFEDQVDYFNYICKLKWFPFPPEFCSKKQPPKW